MLFSVLIKLVVLNEPVITALPLWVLPNSIDSTTNPSLGLTDAVTEPLAILFASIAKSDAGRLVKPLPSPKNEPLNEPLNSLAITLSLTPKLPVNVTSPSNLISGSYLILSTIWKTPCRFELFAEM